MSTTLSMDKATTRTVQLTISNLGVDGVTGCQFWFTAKNAYSDADVDAVLQKVTADFTIVTPGNDTTPAVVTCEITPDETTSLPDTLTILVYDAKMKDTNGKETILAKGKFKVSPTATKAV